MLGFYIRGDKELQRVMDEPTAAETDVGNCDVDATSKFCTALEQLLDTWVVFKVSLVYIPDGMNL